MVAEPGRGAAEPSVALQRSQSYRKQTDAALITRLSFGWQHCWIDGDEVQHHEKKLTMRMQGRGAGALVVQRPSHLVLVGQWLPERRELGIGYAGLLGHANLRAVIKQNWPCALSTCGLASACGARNGWKKHLGVHCPVRSGLCRAKKEPGVLCMGQLGGVAHAVSWVWSVARGKTNCRSMSRRQ